MNTWLSIGKFSVGHKSLTLTTKPRCRAVLISSENNFVSTACFKQTIATFRLQLISLFFYIMDSNMTYFALALYIQWTVMRLYLILKWDKLQWLRLVSSFFFQYLFWDKILTALHWVFLQGFFFLHLQKWLCYDSILILLRLDFSGDELLIKSLMGGAKYQEELVMLELKILIQTMITCSYVCNMTLTFTRSWSNYFTSELLTMISHKLKVPNFYHYSIAKPQSDQINSVCSLFAFKLRKITPEDKRF